MEALLKTHPATWIAIASLSVSIAALIVSSRRLSFDRRLIGAKKATEIRSLFLDYKRKTNEFLQAVDAWEEVCRQCELYPEQSFAYYRKSAESFHRFAEAFIKIANSPLSEETAIVLEPITAYGDDLCKELAAVTEMICRKVTDGCRTRKRMISEQNAAPDRQETASASR